MRPLRLAGLAVLMSAGAGWALCASSEVPVFACTFSGGKKAVEICAGANRAHYAFGKRGQAAELSLSTAMSALEYRPWNGIGRSIHEEVTFRNAGHGYTVYFSFDRFADPPETGSAGGIAVTKAGEELANLTCDPGSISNGIEQLYQLKLDAGQCWDYNEFRWRSECPTN